MNVLGLVALAIALAACGSSATPKANPGTTAASTKFQKAGALPSITSKMVCAKEAQTEIGSNLGLTATRVTTPTWKDHVYTCTYVYPNGSFTLSVKEMSDTKSTTDYFDAYKTQFGVAQNLFGLGQGAFIGKNDDVVARKDYKVLLVDVKNLPKGLGKFVPATTRSDAASNIAASIMACWSDA
jgi:hypothetical protein